MRHRKSSARRWWAGGLVTSLALAGAVSAQAAVDGEYLDVEFGGAFSSGNDYTYPTGEVMAGQLSRMSGREGLNEESFERFVTLDGDDSGISFVSTDLDADAEAFDEPFLAEVAFTPTGEQETLTTLFGAGGNIFVRYQDDALRYGFSSNAGGSWENYVQDVEALPVAGEENVLQVAYEPGDGNVTMSVWLNDTELPTVESGVPARNGAGLGASFAFGNDINSGGRDRGLVGTLERVRVALPDAGFELGSGSAPADPAVLTTTFAGTADDGTYVPTGDDVVEGELVLRDGTPLTSGEGLELSAARHGADFTASDFPITGDGVNDVPFVAEVLFTPQAGQRSLGTLLAVGGNMFVRYQGGQLSYGFSSDASGSWVDHAQSVPAPEAGQEHVLSIAYLPGEEETRLLAYLDGQPLPTVLAPNPATAAGSVTETLGIGNDVNSAGRDRAFQGEIAAVRLAPTTEAFSVGELRFQQDISEQLVDVSFQGTLADGVYQAATGEQVTGALHAEGMTLATGVATGAGEGSRWAWTPADTGLVADGLLTEVAVAAELLAAGGELVDLAGAATLTATAEAEVTLRAGDESVVVPLGDPLSYFALDYYHLGLLSGPDGAVQLYVNGEAAGEPVSLGAASGTDIALLSGTEGEAYRIAVTATTDPAGGTLGAQPCIPAAIEPAQTIAVSASDCAAVIEAKASATRPSDAQMDFHRAELTAFLHYGPNTYYDQEWGHGTEDPARFDPSDLDTDQWARTLADNGFRYAILTVKHHDGFMLYPSRYTDHTVASSPWQDGEGDLLRDFAESARAHGLRVGVYLSPADSHQEREGTFGNGSARTERTIPTLVEGDDRAEAVASGELPTFTYEATDYGAHFLNTLYEILTEYGDIDEMWFDGAGGNTAGTERYDHDSYFDLIKQLQPDALVAIAGNDVRWVGNEHGLARDAEWNPQAVRFERRMHALPGEQHPNLGSMPLVQQAVTSGQATHIHWFPAEADVSIRPGWFWHQNQNPKSVGQLMNIFDQSIARNSVLLLNVPPTTAGQLDQRDVARLAEWTEEIQRQMPVDLALGRPVTVDVGDGEVVTDVLTDGRSSTAVPNETRTGTYTLDLGEQTRVTRVELAEDIRGHGQQVESYTIEARTDGGEWEQIDAGPTVGYKRIVNVDAVADELRVTVRDARGPVHLSTIGVYSAVDEAPEAPTSYYLDPSAEVAGPGTLDAPFASLEQLQSVTLPVGSTLFVRRGTEVTGDFRLWGYGTEEEPITLASYGEGVEPVYRVEDTDATTAAGVLSDLGYDVRNWVAAAVEEPTDPAPEPTDPAPEPTDPEPTDPEPTDPAPEPTDPAPTDPEPTDPEPTETPTDEPTKGPADETGEDPADDADQGPDPAGGPGDTGGPDGAGAGPRELPSTGMSAAPLTAAAVLLLLGAALAITRRRTSA